MVETSTLLSLLQFVALAAPAIAILMQVIQERETNDVVFHLLTSSLILIIFGGLIITYTIFSIINQPILSIGIILIFGSFLILAGALGFTTILTLGPETGGDISNLPEQIYLTLRNTGPTLMSFLMIVLSYIGVVLLVRGIVNNGLSYGFFAEQRGVDPIIFFYIIAALLGVQSVIKLVENDKLPGGGFEEVFEATFTIIFTWMVGYSVFAGPLFLIGYLLTEVEVLFLPLAPTNILLNIPYGWAGFVALILFAVDVDLD